MYKVELRLPQRFPLTFKLAGPAANSGARHGLVVLDAQQYYSGGCPIGETTVKGGIPDNSRAARYALLVAISGLTGKIQTPVTISKKRSNCRVMSLLQNSGKFFTGYSLLV